LDKDTLQTILIRGIRDDCLDLLNLMGGGDISQIEYDHICELCKIYSQGTSKHGKGLRDISARITKSSRRRSYM
jgi:hypothetical protein